MNDVTKALVETARHLSAIQFEGVKDDTGFNNADKTMGAYLADLVAADPSNEEWVAKLAGLVTRYRRQSQSLVGQTMFEAWKALASDLTPTDRDAAKHTVLTRPENHPQYGKRLVLQFPFNESFNWTLRNIGAKPFKTQEGWRWSVRESMVDEALAALRKVGAHIVGETTFPEASVETPADSKGMLVAVTVNGKKATLAFAYRPDVVAAVKTVEDRRYDSTTRTWSVPTFRLPDVLVALSRLQGLDLSQVEAAASNAPAVAAPAPRVAESPIVIENLPDTLYRYQRDGIGFLTRPITDLQACGPSTKGIILGDEMGLGKTVQAIISAHAAAGKNGRILIICPASLKLNWQKEIRFWVGSGCGEINLVNGKAPATKARWNIANYDVLSKHYYGLEALGFDVLILDEAHRIKNHTANWSRLITGAGKKSPAAVYVDGVKQTMPVGGLASLARKRVYLLTGTPLTNRLKDMFNLLRACGHPLGRNFKYFGDRFCEPKFNGWGTTYDGASNVEELRRAIDPIFIQRKKADHLDLPAKTRTWLPVEVDLTEYRAVYADYEARRRAGELSSAFSQLSALNESRVATAVAKVPRTIEIVRDMVDNGQKVVVFSVYTRVLEKITAAFGDEAVVLDGSRSQAQRQAAVDAFMGDPSKTVFVGQLQAAGVGITLTSATNVVFNDLDWVPANHLQAEDRIYRIGQDLPVTITYVLAAGTIDETLAILLEEKLKTINEFEQGSISLFDALMERLATAPQNHNIKGHRAA